MPRLMTSAVLAGLVLTLAACNGATAGGGWEAHSSRNVPSTRDIPDDRRGGTPRRSESGPVSRTGPWRSADPGGGGCQRNPLALAGDHAVFPDPAHLAPLLPRRRDRVDPGRIAGPPFTPSSETKSVIGTPGRISPPRRIVARSENGEKSQPAIAAR